MPSTTALLTALTGLNANARSIDVIGNNIANINTTSFKSNRMMFSNMFSRTLSSGTPPGDTTGGTNPHQVGYGVEISGTQRNFGNGAITTTGDARDLAVEGDGFFVVNRGDETMYTRDGSFRQNSANDLVTINGDRVQGYGVDSDFNVVSGALTNINVPLGGTYLAEATENVTLSGLINSGGDLPTSGSVIGLGSAATAGFTAVSGANPPPAGGNALELTTRLVDIADPTAGAGSAARFAAGQSLELRNAEKGNKRIPASTLDITATTTVQDLATFLEDALGIERTVTNPGGGSPGVTLDTVTGRLTIVGNTGRANDIDIDQSDLRLIDAAGVAAGSPFVSTKAASANGESVRTNFVVYDSLGGETSIDATLVLDSKTSSETTWRYYIESAADSDLNPQAATGTLVFDTNGDLENRTPIAISVDRVDNGILTPISFQLSFADGQSQLKSAVTSVSSLENPSRDGSPVGTLADFSVGQDGTISGNYTNGRSRTLGRVVLATFSNNEGLNDVGGNLYRPGPNSGPPSLVTPGALGSGQIVGGALEASNVDMGEEFIKLIQASTGYSANSRIIRTTDELMQQLLVIGR